MKCKIVMLEKISEIKKITEQEMGDYFGSILNFV